MNRLAPLIVRRAGPRAAVLAPHRSRPFDHAQVAGWLDDLRLFATGWVGGLVFFGTLFG